MKNIKFIIGLGNPGFTYQNTYHNIGFLALDSIIKNLPASDRSTIKFKSAGRIFQYAKADGLVLIKPLLSMNLSGEAAKKALNYFGASPGKTLLVHDDSDITIGNFKLSFGHGSAGHRGVESVIKSLGTKNFWRLKIGIRPREKIAGLAAPARKKADDFVLKKISAKDKPVLEKIFSKIPKSIQGENVSGNGIGVG